jgi:hypothetical protein
MSVPIPLRVDFDAARVRGLAKKTKDGPQARRFGRWSHQVGRIARPAVDDRRRRK